MAIFGGYFRITLKSFEDHNLPVAGAENYRGILTKKAQKFPFKENSDFPAFPKELSARNDE
jgi:hypothetical protein